MSAWVCVIHSVGHDEERHSHRKHRGRVNNNRVLEEEEVARSWTHTYSWFIWLHRTSWISVSSAFVWRYHKQHIKPLKWAGVLTGHCVVHTGPVLTAVSLQPHPYRPVGWKHDIQLRALMVSEVFLCCIISHCELWVISVPLFSFITVNEDRACYN